MSISHLHGRVVGQQHAADPPPLLGPAPLRRRAARRGRARGRCPVPASRIPASRRARDRHDSAGRTLKSPARTPISSRLGERRRRTPPRAASSASASRLSADSSSRAGSRRAPGRPSGSCDADGLADAALLRPREPREQVEAEPRACSRRKRARVEHERAGARTRSSSRASRIAFACPVSAERSSPGGRSGGDRSRPSTGNGPSVGGARRRRTRASRSTARARRALHSGSSCRQSTSGPSAVASRTISSRCASRPGG